MKLTFLSVFIFSVFAGMAADSAAAEPAPADAGAPEWAELFGDAPLPVLWQSATAAAERIARDLPAGQLAEIPDWAETIHLAALALNDQVRLPEAGAARRLRAALEHAAQLADEVLEAASHDEPDLAAVALRRLRSALELTRARLPQELVSAPPETPRFAKARPHQHAAH